MEKRERKIITISILFLIISLIGYINNIDASKVTCKEMIDSTTWRFFNGSWIFRTYPCTYSSSPPIGFSSTPRGSAQIFICNSSRVISYCYNNTQGVLEQNYFGGKQSGVFYLSQCPNSQVSSELPPCRDFNNGPFDGTIVIRDDLTTKYCTWENSGYSIVCRNGKITAFCLGNKAGRVWGYYPGQYDCDDSLAGNGYPSCKKIDGSNFNGSWAWWDVGGENDFAVTCHEGKLLGVCLGTNFYQSGYHGSHPDVYLCAPKPYTFVSGSASGRAVYLSNISINCTYSDSSLPCVQPSQATNPCPEFVGFDLGGTKYNFLCNDVGPLGSQPNYCKTFEHFYDALDRCKDSSSNQINPTNIIQCTATDLSRCVPADSCHTLSCVSDICTYTFNCNGNNACCPGQYCSASGQCDNCASLVSSYNDSYSYNTTGNTYLVRCNYGVANLNCVSVPGCTANPIWDGTTLNFTCPAGSLLGHKVNYCNLTYSAGNDPRCCVSSPSQTKPTFIGNTNIIECQSDTNCSLIYGNCSVCDSTGKCVPKSAGSVCRDSAGPCDIADTCNGVSMNCSSDSFNASTTVCRNNVSICDAVEKCTGSSAQCPTDGNKSCSGTTLDGCCIVSECSHSQDNDCPVIGCSDDGACSGLFSGPCVQGSHCNSGVCEPIFYGTSQLCRPSTGDCDAPEYCDGGNAICPIIDSKLPSGTACNTLCSNDSKCDGNGVCVGGTSKDPLPAYCKQGAQLNFFSIINIIEVIFIIAAVYIVYLFYKDKKKKRPGKKFRKISGKRK